MPPKKGVGREDIINSKYWRPQGANAEVTSLASALPIKAVEADSLATTPETSSTISPYDCFWSGSDNGKVSLWDMRNFQGNNKGSRKGELSFDFAPFAISEIKQIGGTSVVVAAGETLGIFDIRKNGSSPLKTHKHPIEITNFGSYATLPFGLDEAYDTGSPFTVGEDFVWFLDEDGVVYTLAGVIDEISPSSTSFESNREKLVPPPPPLRLTRRPFGKRTNIGSGLSYFKMPITRETSRLSADSAFGGIPHWHYSQSLGQVHAAVTLGMDCELQLYATEGVSSWDHLIQSNLSGTTIDKDGTTTPVSSRQKNFTLKASMDVGMGATPPKQGGASVQMSNPALATCMDVSWPYAACGRADGMYVIVDLMPAPSEEDEADDKAQPKQPFAMEVALASPAHAVNGIAALQWLPQEGTKHDVLVTVALSGELSAWQVGHLLEPPAMEEEQEEEEDDPRCLFADDVRSQCVDKAGALANTMLVLPGRPGADSGAKFIVGASDGCIAVFDSGLV